jgi:ABC-type multidrug transport system fused ATPase/permease subunit
MVWEFAKKNPTPFIVMTILSLSLPVIDLILPFTFAAVIKAVQQGDQLKTPLIYFGLSLLAIRLIYYIRDLNDAHFLPLFIHFTQKESVARIIDSMKATYDTIDIGAFTSKLIKLPWSISNLLDAWRNSILPAVLVILLSTWYTYREVDKSLAYVMGLLGMLFIFYVVVMVPIQCTRTSHQRDKSYNKIVSFIDDIFRNMASIYAYHTTSKELGNLTKHSQDYIKFYGKTIHCSMTSHVVSTIISVCIIGILLTKSKNLLESKQMKIATFVTLTMLVQYILRYTMDASSVVRDMTFQYGILSESLPLYQESPEYQAYLGSKRIQSTPEPFSSDPPSSGIYIRNMHYSIPARNESLFHGITVHLPRGQLVHIKGPNGSGKSTLLKIILHHIIPDEGDIYIDGEPIKDAYTNVAYLPQNPVLFDATLYDNVVYGERHGGDPPAKEQIQSMIQQIGLSDVLPSVETRVGKGGANLSGGQRQMVLFLRAWIRPDKGYILLDEPTSALDKHSREILVQLIHKAIRDGKTVIMVTHDEELAKKANVAVDLVDLKNNIQSS